MRSAFLQFFRAQQPHRRALELPGAGQRPDAAVHQCRHGAVQGRVPGQGPARLPARGHQPALRACRRQAQRPGERRLHRPAPHLLRDAGQLLLRRLLQARRHPLRLGLPDLQPAPRPGAAVVHGVPRRRRGGRHLAEGHRHQPASASRAWARRRTSGRWATPARAGRAARSSTTTAPQIPGGPPGSPDEDGDR